MTLVAAPATVTRGRKLAGVADADVGATITVESSSKRSDCRITA